MTRECDRFESEFLESVDFQRHLKNCSDCRLQVIAHRQMELTERRSPHLGLSINFNSDLRVRLGQEKALQKRVRTAQRVLQLYWLAAGIVSLILVLQIQWPTKMPPTAVLASTALFVACMAFFVLMLFGGRLAKGYRMLLSVRRRYPT